MDLLKEQEEVLQDSSKTEITPNTSEEYEIHRGHALLQAITDESMIASVLNAGINKIQSMGFEEDPEFNIANFSDQFSEINEEYWDEFKGTKNEKHFNFLFQKYKKETEISKYLDGLGIEGVLYRVAGAMLDVPAIAAIQKATMVSKLGNTRFMNKINSSYIGRSLVAGTIEGAFEGVRQLTSEKERTEMDMLLAIGAGGLLGGLYKPKIYDQEVSDTITKVTKETINVRGTGQELSKNNIISSAVENAQFNVTTAFKKSPSPTMNEFGNSMFHDVLNPDLSTPKFIEVKDQVQASVNNLFSNNFDPLFKEYMEKIHGDSSMFLNKSIRFKKQQEFYELAGDLALGRPNKVLDSLDEGFKSRLAEAHKKMSNDSYEALYRAEHPLFVDGSIQKADDYMPVSWLKDKLKANISEGKFSKQDFQQAVLNGLTKKLGSLDIGVDPTRLEAASKKFTETLLQADAKVGDSNFWQQAPRMKEAIEDLTEMLDLSPEDAAAVAERLTRKTKADKKGFASSTKARTPLDLEGSYTNADGVTINLHDYVDNNIQNLWHKYSHSMSGDTALRRAGITDRSELAELRSKVVEELGGINGQVPKENEKYLTNFDATIEHLLGVSSKVDPDGNAWKVTRMLNNLTNASALGATWFAMAAELARVAHRAGVGNLFKSLPALKQFTRAYKGGKTSEAYKELMAMEALGGEINQMPSISKYEDMLSDTSGSVPSSGLSRFLTKAEQLSDVASNLTMMVGGSKSGTSLFEYWHAVAARVKAINLVNKGLDDNAYFYFKQYGFDKETTDKIAEQIKKFADKSDPNFPLLNLDKWDDNLGYRWSLGMRRQSYELVQRVNFGDHLAVTLQNRLIGDTILGKLMMNLKGYMTVAYNKQLSKGVVDLTRGGKDMMDTLGNWTYQTVAASLSYTAKVHTQYANDPDKIEEMLEPSRMAANVFSMYTFSTILPTIIDTAAEATTGEPIVNTFSRSQPAGLPTIAPLSYLTKAAKGVKGLANLASPWADASEAELRAAFGSLPLNNAIGIKYLTTEIAKTLAEK